MILGRWVKMIKFIDLFSGIGGFHQGIKPYGECVFACEIDKHAQETYTHNFPSTFLANDITNISPDQIPDHDLLCAGFPCQPFSIAGQRKGLEDERGSLIFNIIQVLETKKPQMFLLENVKNLVSHNHGLTFHYIKTQLMNAGYYISYQVLNTAYYGNIPQNRERVYIVGFRDKTKFLNFSFPYPVALTVGVRDLLEMDVPERFYWRSDHTKDVAKDDRVYQWRRNYIRANKSGLCPTLTANTGTGGNNVPLVSDNRGVRRLTDRECLRLQGFPDTFAFPDNVCLSQRYKQIGNSVSVPVVSSIVEKMLWAFYSKEVPTIKDTQGVQLGLF